MQSGQGHPETGVVQWVKSLPADLAISHLIPGGGNLFNSKQGSFAQSLSLSLSVVLAYMTEILLKRT